MKRYNIYTSLKEYDEKSLIYRSCTLQKSTNKITTFYKISASFSQKKMGKARGSRVGERTYSSSDDSWGQDPTYSFICSA
jgi:hypothetical protein